MVFAQRIISAPSPNAMFVHPVVAHWPDVRVQVVLAMNLSGPFLAVFSLAASSFDIVLVHFATAKYKRSKNPMYFVVAEKEYPTF